MSLKVLASQLGMSTSTVSRAMNDYPDISQKTKDRVRLAANQLGYQANAAARRLVSGKSKNVGLLLPLSNKHRSSGFLDHILSGATEALIDHDYLLSAIAVPRDDQELDRLRYLVDGRILDAAILVRTRINDPRINFLLERNFPFVCYGRSERAGEFAWLDMDNEAAMQLSIDNLLLNGFDQIAFINASEDFYFAKMRHDGFCSAMKKAGKITLDCRTICSGLNEDDGFSSAQELLQLDPSINAILCANDTVAVGALKACKRAGRKPGKDIAIIGYNNSPSGRYTEPALTTIQHDEPIVIGHQLGEMVVRRLQGEPIKNLQKLMPPQWVSRETCGAINQSEKAQPTHNKRQVIS
jgi:LacI family transcriptional regulator